MSRCPKFTFQLSIIWKWHYKQISTNFSFKITIRKRHSRWHSMTLKRNHYFYLGILNDERSKIIIILPSFQLVTRLNSQNRNETILLSESATLICIWILVFPIGIIQVSTPWKWSFSLFQFLTRLLTSNHFNLISS